MTRGRSIPYYERCYIDAYDMSAYSSDFGERGAEREEYEDNSVGAVGVGVVCGVPKIMFGPLNGVFDNTATSGIHVLAAAAQGARRYVMHSRGVQAVPAIGDDAFCAAMLQKKYASQIGKGVTSVTLTFSGLDVSVGMNYGNPWGVLLQPLASKTGTNSANTNADNGAATTGGGWLMYMVQSITGAGTVTVSVDDSANGSTWLALAGATSGAIATASAPTCGIVQLATNATVRQFLRPQWAFGGAATAAIISLAFMRG